MVVASHGSRRNSNSNSNRNRNRQPLRSTSNTGGASRGVLGDGMGTRVKSRALTHGGGGAGLTGARKVDRFSRPSARLTQQYGKVAALGRSRAATPFSRMYQGGGAPFRIDHGCNRNQLAWNCPIDELSYDPLLETCFEGIVELEHPYVFMSRTALRELLEAGGARAKVLAPGMLERLVKPLRHALMHRDAGVVLFAMEASRLLSRAAGAALNPFLKLLMMQLYKHAFSRVEGVAEAITETLQCLEEQGGDDALAQIKRKIPTYCSIRI